MTLKTRAGSYVVPRGGFRVTGGVGPLLQSWGAGEAVSEVASTGLPSLPQSGEGARPKTKGSGLREDRHRRLSD